MVAGSGNNFGGKPTYHKEKRRNERVRDNKMKCVKADCGERRARGS